MKQLIVVPAQHLNVSQMDVATGIATPPPSHTQLSSSSGEIGVRVNDFFEMPASEGRQFFSPGHEAPLSDLQQFAEVVTSALGVISELCGI